MNLKMQLHRYYPDSLTAQHASNMP